MEYSWEAETPPSAPTERAAAPWHHGPNCRGLPAVSETLRRLLADLAREVACLSSDNAALRQEISELRSGGAKNGDMRGGAAAKNGGGTPKGSSVVSLDRGSRWQPLYEGEVVMANLASPAGPGFSPAPPTPLLACLPLPGVCPVLWGGKPCRALPRPEELAADFAAARAAGEPLNGVQAAQVTPAFLSGGSDSLTSEDEVSTVGEVLQVPQVEVSLATSRHWRLQFDRMRKEKEQIAATDLGIVVSRHEHNIYGHNKHPQRTVNKTVKLIRQVYGPATRMSSLGNEGPAGRERCESRESLATIRESLGNVRDSASTIVARASGARTPPSEACLDWETFLAFMSDDDAHGRISEEEGGDAEYLRKALRAEAFEFIAEEARKEIVERQREEVDPRPTGCLSLILERLPPPIILANAVILGLQSDMDSPIWEVLELFFLAFYLLEIVLKFRFLGCRRFFRGSEARWNILDLGCIITSLTDLLFKALQAFVDSEQDSGVIAVLKFLRLARLARIIKSFRSQYFDDLKIMSLGILSGAKVLAWAVVLFFACVFVLGVIMREMVGQTEEFRNVPAAMFSVFRCLTDGCSAYNGTPLHEKMREQFGSSFMIPYILIFLIVNFGLFNLIVAVFIDRVVSISVKAKQQDLGQREAEMRVAIEEMLVSLTSSYHKHPEFRKTVGSEGVKGLASMRAKKERFHYNKTRRADTEDIFERGRATEEAMQSLRAGKVQITRELFTTWLTDPDVLHLLENLEIDTATKSEIFDVCDVDKSGSLTCDELVNGLMRLRGPISKCDVIAIRLKVRYLTKILEDIHHMLGA